MVEKKKLFGGLVFVCVLLVSSFVCFVFLKLFS